MAEIENDRADSLLDEAAAAANGSQPEPEVDVKETAKDRVQGGQVHMHQSSARVVEASAVRMEDSAAAFVQASVVDARDSALALTLAREARLSDVNSPLLIAGKVEARNTRALIILAWRVDGQVESVLGPLALTAVAAGLAVVLLGLRWVRALVGAGPAGVEPGATSQP